MSFKEKIFIGKFSGTNTAFFIKTYDFIDKQKRLAGRQKRFNIFCNTHYVTFLITTAPLWPPNPKFALIAQSMFPEQPLFGT